MLKTEIAIPPIPPSNGTLDLVLRKLLDRVPSKSPAVYVIRRDHIEITTADAGLYRVRIGNYMGQNFGVITKISESEITLRELFQDAGGDLRTLVL